MKKLFKGIVKLVFFIVFVLFVMTGIDYYLVKETADAAMEDAIDMTYLRTCGLYRIDKEKFVENFIYRFANNVDATRDYDIKFYDINEVPPKVSVKVDSLTVLSVKGKDDSKEAADITTSYDAILETTYYGDFAVEEGLKNMSLDQCKKLIDLGK